MNYQREGINGIGPNFAVNIVLIPVRDKLLMLTTSHSVKAPYMRNILQETRKSLRIQSQPKVKKYPTKAEIKQLIRDSFRGIQFPMRQDKFTFIETVGTLTGKEIVFKNRLVGNWKSVIDPQNISANQKVLLCKKSCQESRKIIHFLPNGMQYHFVDEREQEVFSVTCHCR